MAERKRFRVAEINVKLVRALLDEHDAPLPKFYALLPGDEHWLRSTSGVVPQGQCNYNYDNGDCTIFLRDDGYEDANVARSVVIHELRHWWQYNARNTPIEKRLSRFYSLRLLVECAIIVLALSVTVLCALAGGWKTVVGIGYLLLTLGVLVLLIYDSALGRVLYCWRWQLPLKNAWSEYDAAQFTKTNHLRSEWREAIKVEEI